MKWKTWLVLAWLIGAGSTGYGQSVTGSARLRGESWDWFGEGPAGSYTFVGGLIRAAVSDQKPRWGWRLELAAPVLLGLPDDAVQPGAAGQLGAGASYWQASDSATEAVGLFLKQAFLRFGKPVGQGGQSVRLGRFELIDGTERTPADATVAGVKRGRIAHRLIGNFGWTHVQRSYDGIHYAYDRPELNVTAAALGPTRGVFDVDGWDHLDVGLVYAAISTGSARSDWRVFGIAYNDYRDDPMPVKTDNRAPIDRVRDVEDVSIGMLGGHYVHALATDLGVVDVLAWGVIQQGDWGELEHNAHAFSVEAGVQPKIIASLKPWLRVGYTHSSGDDEAADDQHQTFFQVLPTPRWYARFPFYNMMNLNDAMVSLIVRPSPRATVRAEAHILELAEAADLWYAGGGAFEPNTFGYAGRPSNGAKDLATTFDIAADFRVNTWLSVNGYLAFAKGGDVVKRIYDGGSARLGYIEIELRK